MSERTARVRIRGRYRIHIRVVVDPSVGMTYEQHGELTEHLGKVARAWVDHRGLGKEINAGGET